MTYIISITSTKVVKFSLVCKSKLTDYWIYKFYGIF